LNDPPVSAIIVSGVAMSDDRIERARRAWRAEPGNRAAFDALWRNRLRSGLTAVEARAEESGLFDRTASGAWRHLGLGVEFRPATGYTSKLAQDESAMGIAPRTFLYGVFFVGARSVNYWLAKSLANFSSCKLPTVALFVAVGRSDGKFTEPKLLTGFEYWTEESVASPDAEVADGDFYAPGAQAGYNTPAWVSGSLADLCFSAEGSKPSAAYEPEDQTIVRGFLRAPTGKPVEESPAEARRVRSIIPPSVTDLEVGASAVEAEETVASTWQGGGRAHRRYVSYSETGIMVSGSGDPGRGLRGNSIEGTPVLLVW